MAKKDGAIEVEGRVVDLDDDEAGFLRRRGGRGAGAGGALQPGENQGREQREESGRGDQAPAGAGARRGGMWSENLHRGKRRGWLLPPKPAAYA